MRFTAVQKHPRYRLNAAVDLVTVAAALETTAADNISLGGIFVCTTTPLPLASPVRLRLRPADDAAIGLSGVVVHVVDAAAAAARSLPMGAGIQFHGLPPPTELLLRRFVDGLARQAVVEAELSAPARFITSATVDVKASRAVVQALWARGLQHGGLFVVGDAPPLGTMVRVFLGPLELLGEVVHLGQGDGFVTGAGVHLKDLEGPKRAALQRFMDGEVDALTGRAVRADSEPLLKVLAAARRLFSGIEDNDPLAGLGLPETATADEVSARVAGLRQVFAAAPVDASPPQAARIASASRTLDRLEPVVLARVAALRLSAELRVPSRVFARGTTVERTVDNDAVTALLTEAGDLGRRGRHGEARKVLERALELAPDDATVQQRLVAVDRAIDLVRAIDLIGQAEVIVRVDMTDQAVDHALEATRLSDVREIHLRAIRVLAQASRLQAATSLAEALVLRDGRDHHALQALLILHERAERWPDALRAGEALLRMKPGDSDLQKRVKKLANKARS